MKLKKAKTRNRGKLAGRSELARIAHFRVAGGAMGGDRRQQARRRRQRDRMDERQAETEG